MSADDHNGLDVDSLVMARVENGEWTYFSDEEEE